MSTDTNDGNRKEVDEMADNSKSPSAEPESNAVSTFEASEQKDKKRKDDNKPADGNELSVFMHSVHCGGDRTQNCGGDRRDTARAKMAMESVRSCSAEEEQNRASTGKQENEVTDPINKNESPSAEQEKPNTSSAFEPTEAKNKQEHEVNEPVNKNESPSTEQGEPNTSSSVEPTEEKNKQEHEVNEPLNKNESPSAEQEKPNTSSALEPTEDKNKQEHEDSEQVNKNESPPGEPGEPTEDKNKQEHEVNEPVNKNKSPTAEQEKPNTLSALEPTEEKNKQEHDVNEPVNKNESPSAEQGKPNTSSSVEPTEEKNKQEHEVNEPVNKNESPSAEQEKPNTSSALEPTKVKNKQENEVKKPVNKNESHSAEQEPHTSSTFEPTEQKRQEHSWFTYVRKIGNWFKSKLSSDKLEQNTASEQKNKKGNDGNEPADKNEYYSEQNTASTSESQQQKDKQEHEDSEQVNKNEDDKAEGDDKNSKERCELDLVVVLPLTEAVRGFCKAFGQKMPNVRIREVPLNHFVDDQTGNNLVIVISNIVTRTLDDLSATLNKISKDMHHRVFLIALHCVRPQYVVEEAADEVRRHFPSIKETVDIVYFRKNYIEGLHECDYNEKALDIIKRRIDAGDFAKK